jgi:pyrroloquinoline quinone biosynthesis protein D
MADAAVPRLPRGVRLRWCAVRESWFLLVPERAMKLDAPGAAILRAVDGVRDVRGIAAALAAEFDAAPERIAADARAFLGRLAQRRLVEAT